MNFSTIRNAIGESGSLVAIDYIPEMVGKATDRVENHGWENITVIRADATTASLGGPYDAALATLALSVMPDVGRAVQNIHATLKPGAPLGVLDIQEFQSGAVCVFNPFLKRFLRWYANWNPNENVRLTIDEFFGEVECLNTFMHDEVYTIIATQVAPEPDSSKRHVIGDTLWNLYLTTGDEC